MSNKPLIVINSGKGLPALSQISELLKNKDLFIVLTKKEIIVRYKQTLLGITWVIFQPLFSASIFTILFGIIFNFPSGTLPYPVFVYTGLVFWTFFAPALSVSSKSLESSEALIKKVYFPRIIIPLASISARIVDLGVSTIFLIILLMVFNIVPHPLIILLFPFNVFMVVLFVTGAGLFLSALNVKFRDVRQVLPFFIQMFFFLTPVIYSVRIIPDNLQWLLYFNPLASAIESTRVLLNGVVNINVTAMAVSFMVSVVVFVVGLLYFARSEWYFADIV